ncbi:MAG TPA: DNA alkylation response protein, partial [Burkholderiales bacterium]|nr:DNA alkylation response protein [Burkholderiales bacterium]
MPQLSIPPLTHQIDNQVPPLSGYNPWASDPLLQQAVIREGGGWIEPQAHALGTLVGGEHMQELAREANHKPPELHTHDAQGHRIDEVRYHPAYHELMGIA